MSTNLTNGALACLLTDAELAERKKALQKEIFVKVKKVEEVDDGYLFHLDNIENLLPNLFHFILLEKECCPFFQQDVTIRSNNAGIIWKVSGKDGVKEMLNQMLEEIKFPEN